MHDNTYYPYSSGEYKVIGFSFWSSSIDGTPPSPEATRFRLIFYGEGTGTDSYDGAVYDLNSVMPTLVYYTEWMTLP